MNLPPTFTALPEVFPELEFHATVCGLFAFVFDKGGDLPQVLYNRRSGARRVLFSDDPDIEMFVQEEMSQQAFYTGQIVSWRKAKHWHVAEIRERTFDGRRFFEGLCLPGEPTYGEVER